MNRWIAGNLILPFHERVVRRETLSMAKRLERSQWCDPERLEALQVSKLRALLDHAWRRCPFYRRRMEQAGLAPRDVDSLEALRGLPVLSRQEVTRHREQMAWRDVSGGLIRSNTGGSTGEPLVFYVDRRRQAAFKAARIRAHSWFGIGRGDRQAYLWGAPAELSAQDLIRAFRDRITNEMLLNAFRMSPERMDYYLSRIETFAPSCIFGYPSSIELLCEHGLRAGRKLRLPKLRAVLVTGEVLYEHQRQKIESYFGAPVANGYGSRDGGFIAHECPEGSMHTMDEYILVELLDENARPVS